MGPLQNPMTYRKRRTLNTKSATAKLKSQMPHRCNLNPMSILFAHPSDLGEDFHVISSLESLAHYRQAKSGEWETVWNKCIELNLKNCKTPHDAYKLLKVGVPFVTQGINGNLQEIMVPFRRSMWALRRDAYLLEYASPKLRVEGAYWCFRGSGRWHRYTVSVIVSVIFQDTSIIKLTCFNRAQSSYLQPDTSFEPLTLGLLKIWTHWKRA